MIIIPRLFPSHALSHLFSHFSSCLSPRHISPNFSPLLLLFFFFSSALVWGTSVKHVPQKVGKDHVLEDEDVVQIVKQ